MPVSPDLENKILITYAKTRSPFKTSAQCDTDLAIVFEVLKKNKQNAGVAVERHGGKGRPELEPFTVARRRASETGWDNEDPVIEQAREDYAAGTHEMVTGRDGGWLILYSIPRRRVDRTRKDYFLPEVQ